MGTSVKLSQALSQFYFWATLVANTLWADQSRYQFIISQSWIEREALACKSALLTRSHSQRWEASCNRELARVVSMKICYGKKRASLDRKARGNWTTVRLLSKSKRAREGDDEDWDHDPNPFWAAASAKKMGESKRNPHTKPSDDWNLSPLAILFHYAELLNESSF